MNDATMRRWQARATELGATHTVWTHGQDGDPDRLVVAVNNHAAFIIVEVLEDPYIADEMLAKTIQRMIVADQPG